MKLKRIYLRVSDKVYFTIEDVTYVYEISGNGPPVILLHGFTGSRSTWKYFIQKWKHHFKCIAIDLPGHGETKNHSPMSMERCCHGLAKLFAHLNLSAAHVVGYSMGGRTALSFAMLYPELILSLTLESSSPGLKSIDEQLDRKRQDERLASKIEEEGIETFVQYWENIPLFSTQKNLPENVQREIRKERLSQSTIGLANSLRGMGTGVQPSWWNKLWKLTNPTLLIVGSLDHKFVKINKEMKQSLQNAQMEVVHSAGHAVHIEQPTVFNRLVGNFIRKM